MDPEIERALKDGVPPEAIVAELTKRQLPVPPQLAAMVQSSSDGPTIGEKYGPAAAAMGAAAGTLGGAGYAANQAFGSKPRARRLLTKAVTEAGGPQTLQDVLEQFQAAGRGDMVTLGDLSPRMGAAADFVATNSPAARAQMSQIHEARQAGVPKRIAADVEGQIGYQAPNFMKGVTKESQSQWAASDAGYEGLRAKNPMIAPAQATKLKAYIESPQLADVWKQAAEVSAIGPMPPAGALSFETLQGMKERMDDAVGHAFATGRGPLGARLAKARDRLVETMADAIPEYRPVASQYHAFSKHAEMLQAGQDMWKTPMQLADLEMTVRELSPEDLRAVRSGMGGAVLQDIENSKTNVNLAKQLLSSSAVTEKKLEIVFGSPRSAAAYISRLKLEKQMAGMGDIIGGSATARRLGQGADVADHVVEGAEAVMHPVAAVADVVKNGPKYFAGPTAERLGPLFTSQGYANLSRILRSLPH